MAQWRPSIYEFVDFRAYLKAYYEAAKANLRQFSYRYFSRRAGFASPNFLKLVIDGQRNLGRDSVDQVAEALQLDADETTFFANLVAFNQADTDAERNRYFERLAASRRFRAAQHLDGDLFEYLSHWYYPAIREMAARADFRDDPAWIASQLQPPVKPSQASAALDTLLRLGLLERSEGRIVRGEATLTSGHEVRALGVANYHRQMLERAAESIELIASEERDLSAMTVCIGAPLVPELKRRLREFRETLMDLCDREAEPDLVYQLNIQLFPLTRGKGEKP
jgi:uncharacterized protein (TIGR02147 family)